MFVFKFLVDIHVAKVVISRFTAKLVPRRWLFAKTALPFIIYNKVTAVLCIDLNQERIKNA